MYDLAIGNRTPKPGQRYTHGWVKLVADAKVPDGGFSRNPIHDTSPTSGYMVSYEANGRNNKVVSWDKLKTSHLAAHAKANEDLLQDPSNFQGGWNDPETGLVHLDISRNVQDKDEAIALAKKNNQIAIFDLKTFSSIPTGGTGEKKLSNKSRTLLTPILSGKRNRAQLDLSDDSGLTYWKEVLPETSINYEGRTITFDHQYLTDLAKSFEDGAYDQTPFMLANKDNEHTMDPERYRGDIVEMQVGGPEGEPGLWSKIKFASKEAAAAVVSNPKLGVSARIKEEVRRADGRSFKRAIVHVLGTLDPRVTGMSPWRTVELSSTDSDTVVLDMTSADFSKGKAMPKQKKAKYADLTDEQLAELTPEELDEADAYFQSVIDEAEAILAEDDDEDEEEEVDEEEDELVSSGASLSNRRNGDLDLAVSQANDRANEALRRMAAAEWASERISLIDAGIPPAMVDLCEPILNRPDQMVIDLSNTDGKGATLDVSQIVRDLLAGYEGTVDLSSEGGHIGTPKDGTAEAREDLILAQAKANGGF